MRLFQEYVRSVEKLPCVPDGRLGPSTEEHLQRWTRGGVVSTRAPTIEQWRSGTLGQTEYTDWLSLLGKVKESDPGEPDPDADPRERVHGQDGHAQGP